MDIRLFFFTLCLSLALIACGSGSSTSKKSSSEIVETVPESGSIPESVLAHSRTTLYGLINIDKDVKLHSRALFACNPPNTISFNKDSNPLELHIKSPSSDCKAEPRMRDFKLDLSKNLIDINYRGDSVIVENPIKFGTSEYSRNINDIKPELAINYDGEDDVPFTLYGALSIDSEKILRSKAYFSCMPPRSVSVEGKKNPIKIVIKPTVDCDMEGSVKDFSIDLSGYLNNMGYEGDTVIIGNPIDLNGRCEWCD